MKNTRFISLGYKRIAPKRWSIVDLSNTDCLACIGCSYNSEIELLADLERFANERGYN